MGVLKILYCGIILAISLICRTFSCFSKGNPSSNTPTELAVSSSVIMPNGIEVKEEKDHINCSIACPSLKEDSSFPFSFVLYPVIKCCICTNTFCNISSLQDEGSNNQNRSNFMDQDTRIISYNLIATCNVTCIEKESDAIYEVQNKDTANKRTSNTSVQSIRNKPTTIAGSTSQSPSTFVATSNKLIEENVSTTEYCIADASYIHWSYIAITAAVTIVAVLLCEVAGAVLFAYSGICNRWGHTGKQYADQQYTNRNTIREQHISGFGDFASKGDQATVLAQKRGVAMKEDLSMPAVNALENEYAVAYDVEITSNTFRPQMVENVLY